MICTAGLTVKALRVVVEAATLLLILCVRRRRERVKQKLLEAWKRYDLKDERRRLCRDAPRQNCDVTICRASVNDDMKGRNHPGRENNVARVKTYKEEIKIWIKILKKENRE